MSWLLPSLLGSFCTCFYVLSLPPGLHLNVFSRIILASRAPFNVFSHMILGCRHHFNVFSRVLLASSGNFEPPGLNLSLQGALLGPLASPGLSKRAVVAKWLSDGFWRVILSYSELWWSNGS